MTDPAWTYGQNLLPAPEQTRQRRTWLPIASAAAVLAAVAAALLLVLGGSSGSHDSVADAATLVHGAPARAAQVGSSDITLRMTMRMGGQTVTATGGGSFDYRRHLGQMHVDMAQFGQMTEIVTPTAMYMRMPDSMRGMLGGSARPWLMIRYADFKSQGVDLGKLMSQNGSGDPTAMLRMLSRASQVERVGSATVDGARTTRYSATVGFLDLIRAEGASSAIDLSKLPPNTQNTRMHVEVWIDKTGLTRRMAMTMSGGAFAGGSMDLTMDLLNFGTPVDVAVPPSSVVTDIGALLHR